MHTNMSSEKYMIVKMIYIGWCGFGFIRGIQYPYQCNLIIKPSIHHPMYIEKFVNGLFGCFIYSNLLMLPFVIHKEVYRLEVAVRQLGYEKNDEYYNNLFW